MATFPPVSMTSAAVPHPTGARSLRFREHHQLAVARCLLTLILVVFLPAGLRYKFAFSSLAPGLLLSCVVLAAAGASGLIGRIPASTLSKGLVAAAAVLVGIAAHLGLSLFQWSADLGRAGSSLAGLGLVLCVAPIVYHSIYRAEDAALADALAIVRVALLVMTLLALLGIQPVGELASVKPVWPFTEPSHFALAASPFLIHGCVANGRRERWLWLGVMSILVVLLQSVSLGIATVVAAACSLSLLEIGLFAAIAGSILSFIDLTYFADRLSVSSNSSNLSVLIYIQGTELIQEAMDTTHGWGIAFQQLGFAPTNVLATETIRRVGGGEQNLTDGGFLAVKLGTEFGWFGLSTMALYLWKLPGVVLDLRLIASKRANCPAGVTFAFANFTAFFVELFVRGLGYFSGTALLAIASFGIVGHVKLVERRRASRMQSYRG